MLLGATSPQGRVANRFTLWTKYNDLKNIFRSPACHRKQTLPFRERGFTLWMGLVGRVDAQADEMFTLYQIGDIARMSSTPVTLFRKRARFPLKPALFVRLFVAIAFASAFVPAADAGLVKIVHLNCAEWHARQALLASRREHPLPQRAFHLAGHRPGPRIHFVCDCDDGSADAGAADSASPDDLAGGGGTIDAALGDSGRGSADQPFPSPSGGSSGSSGSFGWAASSSSGSSGGGSAGAGAASDPIAFAASLPWGRSDPSYPSDPSSPLDPAGPGHFDPADPGSPDLFPHTPNRPGPFDPGPFSPVSDPAHGPIPSAPEPSTWLLFGLGAAAVLALKRRGGPAGKRAPVAQEVPDR